MRIKRKKVFVGILIVIITLGYFIGSKIKNIESKRVNSEILSQKQVQRINNEDLKDKNHNRKGSFEDPYGEKVVIAPREFKEGKLRHNDSSIPILMYHHIAPYHNDGNGLNVPKENFRQQMKFLKDNSFETLTLPEAYAFLNNNKPVPEKSVVITFDDGYVDNYTEAYPILKEFGHKATIFMITARVGTHEAFMNLDQLKELEANGIDIEPHTVNHEELNKFPYDVQFKTLKESKEFLEKNLNRKMEFIAYPYGAWNNDTLRAAKEAGYTMGVTVNAKWAEPKDGIYTLGRVFIGPLDTIDNFKLKVSTPKYNIQPHKSQSNAPNNEQKTNNSPSKKS